MSDISDPEDSVPGDDDTSMTDPTNCDFSPDTFLDGSSPDMAPLQPLMMRIQTKNVIKCELSDGRVMNCGDIVWGKIHGFPWWPGRIVTITESVKDSGVVIAQMAHISWFGSSTMSYMDCRELYPFLEYYKSRYNKKKKGPYKVAIKQATMAAQSLVADGSLEGCKSPLSESDDSMTDNNSEDLDNFDELQDMEDLQSLQSLDKENMNSVDNLSHEMLGRDVDYDDLKKIDEDSMGKAESLSDDIDQLNEHLENYSLQINQDIALEMMED